MRWWMEWDKTVTMALTYGDDTGVANRNKIDGVNDDGDDRNVGKILPTATFPNQYHLIPHKPRLPLLNANHMCGNRRRNDC